VIVICWAAKPDITPTYPKRAADHAVRNRDLWGAQTGSRDRAPQQRSTGATLPWRVPLTHLVARRFWLGETLLEATRLSIPCRHIEEVTGKTISDALINRSRPELQDPARRDRSHWRSSESGLMGRKAITSVETVVRRNRAGGSRYQTPHARRSG